MSLYILLKYGDVDAYFEVVVTLLRLFPNIKLMVRVFWRSRECTDRFDASLSVLIGGPDSTR